MAKTNEKCQGTIDGKSCEGHIIMYLIARPITDEQIRENGYLDSRCYKCDTCDRAYKRNKYDNGFHPVT